MWRQNGFDIFTCFGDMDENVLLQHLPENWQVGKGCSLKSFALSMQYIIFGDLPYFLKCILKRYLSLPGRSRRHDIRHIHISETT